MAVWESVSIAGESISRWWQICDSVIKISYIISNITDGFNNWYYMQYIQLGEMYYVVYSRLQVDLNI